MYRSDNINFCQIEYHETLKHEWSKALISHSMRQQIPGFRPLPHNDQNRGNSGVEPYVPVENSWKIHPSTKKKFTGEFQSDNSSIYHKMSHKNYE